MTDSDLCELLARHPHRQTTNESDHELYDRLSAERQARAIDKLIEHTILVEQPDSALAGQLADLDDAWASADEHLRGRLRRAYKWLDMTPPVHVPTIQERIEAGLMRRKSL